MISGERIAIAVGAAAALLLQVLLAPHIAMGFAFPCFVAAYCLVSTVLRPGAAGPVLPFVMGLLYDVISGGPVGAMAFSLTSASLLEAGVFRRVGNGTPLMAVAVLGGGVFLTELLYGLLLLLSGYAASFPDALVYRVLPCFLYDFAISFLLYLALSRAFGQGLGRAPVRAEIKQL